MRRTILLVSLLAVGGVASLSALDQRAEASQQACLRLRDFEGLKKINETTYLASSRHRTKFVVTFQHSCRALEQPNNPYTLRLYNGWECFDRDDVLVFRNGQVCFVQSVAPAPAK
jgi:hypothetical protein